MAEDINELQKEWRAIVLDKLTSIEKDQREIRNDITSIKESFVRQSTLDERDAGHMHSIEVLRDKVDALENFKYKLIGIVIGVNTLLSLVFAVIGIYLSRH